MDWNRLLAHVQDYKDWMPPDLYLPDLQQMVQAYANGFLEFEEQLLLAFNQLPFVIDMYKAVDELIDLKQKCMVEWRFDVYQAASAEDTDFRYYWKRVLYFDRQYPLRCQRPLCYFSAQRSCLCNRPVVLI